MESGEVSRPVLVTGASGFIGSALTRALLERGSPVRALVRSRERLGELADRVEVVEADITDARAVHAAVANVDIIYHIAATFREAPSDFQAYEAVNVGGTENVMRAAADHAVGRVILCSTAGIHGNIAGPPANEEHPVTADNAYEMSKAGSERVAKRISEEKRVPLVIVRPSQVYGPGDTRLLKLFRLAKRRFAPFVGSGNVHYHLVHVNDVVQALLLAGCVEEAKGEVFIIAGPEQPTLNEIFSTLAQILNHGKHRVVRIPAAPVMLAASALERLAAPFGIEPPIYPRRVAFFLSDRRYDISKARRILRYEPEVAMTEGLASTAAWYLEQNWL